MEVLSTLRKKAALKRRQGLGLALGWVAMMAMASFAAQAAEVSWVGPANGQWHVVANWSGGAVPDPEDDVTIAGATVSVNDAREVRGTFTLTANALLLLNHADAHFVASGPTLLDNGRVHVSQGAQADFSRAVSYAWTLCSQSQLFSVIGQGSLLDLSGLRTLTIAVEECAAIQSAVFVSTGGHIDLSGLESTSAGNEDQLAFTLIGGGTMNLDSVQSMDGVFVNVGDGTALHLPAMTSLSHSTLLVALGGAFTANALLTAHDVLFSPAGTEAIAAEALATVSYSFLTVPTSSTWTLPSLTSLEDSSISTPDGALLSLPLLESMGAQTAPAFFTASGSGRTDAPLLREVANTAFAVSLGAVLDLPSFETYTWTLCQGFVPFTAGDAGSQLLFNGLRTFRVPSQGCTVPNLSIAANAGALVDLSGLSSIVAPGAAQISILSGGAGSVVDLSSLASFNAAQVIFFETGGGIILRFSGPIQGVQCHADSGTATTTGIWGDALLLAVCAIGLAVFGWRREVRGRSAFPARS